MPSRHHPNSAQSVANAGTFSTTTRSYRWTSVARITSKAVARVTSNASTGIDPYSRSSSCPRFRFRPPAGLISVQITDAHSPVVDGRRRMFSLLMSSHKCSVPGWLALWVSIAVAQWFAASTISAPASTSPDEAPPAPQKRSVHVKLDGRRRYMSSVSFDQVGEVVAAGRRARSMRVTRHRPRG